MLKKWPCRTGKPNIMRVFSVASSQVEWTYGADLSGTWKPRPWNSLRVDLRWCWQTCTCCVERRRSRGVFLERLRGQMTVTNSGWVELVRLVGYELWLVPNRGWLLIVVNYIQLSIQLSFIKSLPWSDDSLLWPLNATLQPTSASRGPLYVQIRIDRNESFQTFRQNVALGHHVRMAILAESISAKPGTGGVDFHKYFFRNM